MSKNKNKIRISVDWADFKNPITLMVDTDYTTFCVDLSKKQTEELSVRLIETLEEFHRNKNLK